MDSMVILRALAGEIFVYFEYIPLVLLVLTAGIILIRVLDTTIVRLMKASHIERTCISFISGGIKLVSWICLLSFVFSLLGFPHISLLLTGSLSLIIIGLSSNTGTLIQDLFAGLFLLADSDFQVGSTVRIDGIVGKVSSLNIQKTKIIDQKGHTYVVANRVFDSNTYIIESEKGRENSKDTG